MGPHSFKGILDRAKTLSVLIGGGTLTLISYMDLSRKTMPIITIDGLFVMQL